MKVFLIGFMSQGAAKKIAQKGMEIVYWSGKEIHFGDLRQEKNFSNTIFHSIYDSLKAIPAHEVKDLKLDFPPKEIFDAAKNNIGQVLGMISRINYKGLVHSEMMDLFYRYIVYWYGMLKYFKPDVVFFSDIPHVAPNYVVYFLSKIMGIKTVFYRHVKGMPGRLMFFSDYTDYKFLREAYERALLKGVKWEDLSDEMKKYVLTQKQLEKSTMLRYAIHVDKFIKQGAKIPRPLLSLRSIVKNIKSRTLLRGIYRYFFMLKHKKDVLAIDEKRSGLKVWRLYRKWSKIKKSYRREYESLQIDPDFKKKYIYVPLHFQPECNTNPVGDMFDDQILMIRVLSASLPADWCLYVKESPMQWLHYQGSFGRYEGYYKLLNEMPNVRLVPADISTFKLISGAQAVATLTGSAGLESLVLSKPVLLFGFGWYMDCDGVYNVKDVDSCRTALDSVLGGYKPNENKVLAFLYAVEEVSIKGAYSKRYNQFSTVSDDDNSSNLADFLIKTALI